MPFLAWSPLASGFLADGFDLAALGAGDLRRGLRWATQDLTADSSAGLRRGRRPARRAGAPGRAGLGPPADPAPYAIVGARTAAEAADLLPLPTLTRTYVAALARAAAADKARE